MRQTGIPKSVLERLPMYLHYLKSQPCGEGDTISSGGIARALRLGEVQVRKDLARVSGAGKPKVGYLRGELVAHLESVLGVNDEKRAVIVGAGHLGRALLSYTGFAEYGLQIAAAFDTDTARLGRLENGREVFSMDTLEDFCRGRSIDIGIITVPEKSAQPVCDRLIACGIHAIWNFAPCPLDLPEQIGIRQENMAASLAVLAANL